MQPPLAPLPYMTSFNEIALKSSLLGNFGVVLGCQQKVLSMTEKPRKRQIKLIIKIFVSRGESNLGRLRNKQVFYCKAMILQSNAL